MHAPRTHKKNSGFAGLIIGNIAILGLFLILIEGLASYGLLVYDLVRLRSVSERRHTKYDPDLGWVNEPDVYIPDMYGPGVYLRTNAQGFRNNHDITTAVPDGKARIICSGDSFTLGFGVDNAHTWCELLSSLEPRLETVNMGQGGYGVDQAYLWYKRDASKIGHQAQLLGFVTDDFYRMQSGSFSGYAKPVLEVEDGRLVVKNVPVPRQISYVLWITSKIESLWRLRTTEFLHRALLKIGAATTDRHQPTQREQNEKTQKVLRMIFEDLKCLNEQRSSTLVLVYFPEISELNGTPPREWIDFLEGESRSLGIPLINLFREFQSLPADEMANLYLQGYPGGGHLSNLGNELAARAIHDKLINHPALSLPSQPAGAMDGPAITATTKAGAGCDVHQPPFNNAVPPN